MHLHTFFKLRGKNLYCPILPREIAKWKSDEGKKELKHVFYGQEGWIASWGQMHSVRHKKATFPKVFLGDAAFDSHFSH